MRQARKLGWDEVFDADLASEEDLSAALERCLSKDIREKAASIKDAAILSLSDFDKEFALALTVPAEPELRAHLVPPDSRIRAWRKSFKAWKRKRRKNKLL